MVGASVPLYGPCGGGLIYLITPYLPALPWSAGEQFDLGRIGVEGFYSFVDLVGLVRVFPRRGEHGVGYRLVCYRERSALANR